MKKEIKNFVIHNSRNSSSESKLNMYINIESKILIRIRQADWDDEPESNDASIGLNIDEAKKMRDELTRLIELFGNSQQLIKST